MKTHTIIHKPFISVKIPVYAIAAILILILILFYLFRPSSSPLPYSPAPVQDAKPVQTSARTIRLNDYELTKPILVGDLDQEDTRLLPLKQRISQYIEQEKAAGIITSASVYVRLANNGNYIELNDGEQFSPGSLMKVPTLITFLKEAQQNPKLFTKEIFFKKHFGSIPEQTLTGKIMEPGHSYSVKELLYRMIVFSDNDATALLNQNINFPVMQKLFTDLKLPEPRNDQQDYPMAASDYSRFFRVLYNGSYLNWEMSQYALSLLTQSAFKEGIVKNIPPSIKVAHKFGERNLNGEQQLHEFGIFYIADHPYIVGVMTKGKDYTQLPQVLSEVSEIVFQQMEAGEMQ